MFLWRSYFSKTKWQRTIKKCLISSYYGLFANIHFFYFQSSNLVIPEKFQHILRVMNTNIDGRRKIMFALTAIKVNCSFKILSWLWIIYLFYDSSRSKRTINICVNLFIVFVISTYEFILGIRKQTYPFPYCLTMPMSYH